MVQQARHTLYPPVRKSGTTSDAWIESYNVERTHSGKYCFGKTPMQTFLDRKKLSDEKQLDRTDRTAAENQVAA